MSLLAEITVVDCDSCKQIAVTRNDDERTAFDQSWYDGWKVQFCPACSVKPELQQRILEDLQLEEKILKGAKGANDRYNGRTEYAH